MRTSTTTRQIMKPVESVPDAPENVRDPAALLHPLRAVPRAGDREDASVATAPDEEQVIDADATLDEALETMGRLRTARLWVHDEHGRAGQITEADCEEALAHERLHLRALRELGERSDDVITEISSDDAMGGAGSIGPYLWAGASALRCIRTAMVVAGSEAPRSILDFPCGHGRVLRVLKAAFPEAGLAAGDIDTGAVDFCARAFDATPIYAREDPQKMQIDGSYDLIWSGSLLTHLPAHRWADFLTFFETLLAPGGLLVLTLHGRHDEDALVTMQLAEDQVPGIQSQYDEQGFGYAEYRFHPRYGIAIASPAWVAGLIRARTRLELVNYAPESWEPPWPRQDVVACKASPPTTSRTPMPPAPAARGRRHRP